LYSHQWHVGDEEYKKLVLVMMVQSQRPQKINAFGFFDVNFETLSGVSENYLLFLKNFSIFLIDVEFIFHFHRF